MLAKQFNSGLSKPVAPRGLLSRDGGTRSLREQSQFCDARGWGWGLGGNPCRTLLPGLLLLSRGTPSCNVMIGHPGRPPHPTPSPGYRRRPFCVPPPPQHRTLSGRTLDSSWFSSPFTSSVWSLARSAREVRRHGRERRDSSPASWTAASTAFSWFQLEHVVDGGAFLPWSQRHLLCKGGAELKALIAERAPPGGGIKFAAPSLLTLFDC